MEQDLDINKLIDSVKAYNPSCDEDYICRAFALAVKAHEGQKRDSGAPYITHPFAVAEILVSLNMDDKAIAAGLLHDVVEDTEYTLEDITQAFDKELATLVDGVTKLTRIQHRSRQERQVENLRKMIFAMSQDIRIIIIKLSDRLHNMRTLKYHHSPQRQKEISQETKEIYAPLAHRLGIFKVKTELEDLSLKYLDPERYQYLKDQITNKKLERGQYIENICIELRGKLEEFGIKGEIYGRYKSFYSIYNKMIKQQKELNEIFDLNAVRVIVDDVKDCYGALGIIHTLWKPIPGRFKDYIAMPKQNMYQSIHTTLIGPKGEPFEVQIRTWDMHRIAEYGIAAHWKYKEGKSADGDFEQKLSWLRQMLEWQQELKDDQEFMESVKVDLFTDSVYIFTPKGDVYELPRDATPIDFAYRVHTQVGHECVGAKVNRRIVPLDYHVKNGDIVEILTAKGSGPSRDWLQIVKTSQAKNRIRQWFKKEQREENIEIGKDLLEKECRKYTQDISSFLKADALSEAARKLGYTAIEELYAAIGFGDVAPNSVITRIKEDMPTIQDVEADVLPELKPFSGNMASGSHGILVKDIDNVMVRLSHCCNPLPGDDVVGYITRGRGVSIHRKDCLNVAYYQENEPERLMEVTWDESCHGVYQAELEATAIDRPRLTLDIMAVVADTKTNLNGVNVRVNKDKTATISLKLEIKSLDHLEFIMNKIRRVRDVLEVHRLTTSKAGGNDEE
ncbi:MAG: bifunctional (p)ppGpp synthetase/guanosine-3',5'-bis(diphosphate) 3'-pyrophosphohydrolase [Peptococcaceae bacterium]|nr:bifunctional (p)ppGpp synthetase/guanosine-3',5'-bis(diphosphate) 3'-pyrophosphohydrolase [Peptococcaceae bacterium]